MMERRTKSIALITIAASTLAAAFALLLLHSVKIGVAAYIVGVGVVMLLMEPFVGLINYLIFLYIRPQEFLPGFVGLPVMLMIGGATFVVMLINHAMMKKTLAMTKAPQNILMLLLLAAIVMSHLSHLYLHAAIDSGRAFLSTVVMYLLIANLALSERNLKITLYLMTILTVFMALQGIKQYYTGVGIAGQTLIEGRIRGIGIFSDPNDLALTFLIVLPFAFFTLIDSRNLMVKTTAVIAMAVLVYALYLTNSRGGFLSFGMLVFLLFVRRFGLIPGLAAGAAMFFVMFAFGPSRMSELSPEEASAYGRIEAWGRGLEMLRANPLFGVGQGRFMDFHFRTAHNSFVLCASELGLFGFYSWLTLLLISMKNMFFVSREARANGMRENAVIADSIFFAFVGFLTAAFFLSRTYNDLLYVLVGLSAAATQVFVARTGEKYVLMDRRDLLQGFGLMVGVLVLLKIIVMLYW